MSIAYPNLPVRLIGFLPGITTPGGVTHQAIDDVALMRIIPNMTVLECGDATEVETVLDVAQAVDVSVDLDGTGGGHADVDEDVDEDGYQQEHDHAEDQQIDHDDRIHQQGQDAGGGIAVLHEREELIDRCRENPPS